MSLCSLKDILRDFDADHNGDKNCVIQGEQVRITETKKYPVSLFHVEMILCYLVVFLLMLLLLL